MIGRVYTLKIAYIGIDLLYPALEALETSGCEIAEIFSCRTDNVTEFNTRVCGFARERGIPLHLDKITASDIRRLADEGCRMAVCGGYYYRIPVREDILPVVNIHPALLPIGRGAWPMPVTILKGLRESGVTLHKMTEAFDEGDILLQEKITVSPEDDLETLMEKYWALLPGMMRRLAADFDSLYENAIPQGEGEYWECPSEGEYLLEESTDAAEADLILRAFYGYECRYREKETVYGVIRGRVVKDSRMQPVKGKTLFPVADGWILADSSDVRVIEPAFPCQSL